MRRISLWAPLIWSLAVLPLRADSTWELIASTLTYHASHPLHHSTGSTTASKGKGVCKGQDCDFLIAVPVNTFESGDSNRDLHMIQAVNGGTHPMISVRAHLLTEPAPPGFKSDLNVDFGGKLVLYPAVSFEVTEESPGLIETRGVLPLVLSRHSVNRPALLGVPIKDETPVDIETTWRKK